MKKKEHVMLKYLIYPSFIVGVAIIVNTIAYFVFCVQGELLWN